MENRLKYIMTLLVFILGISTFNVISVKGQETDQVAEQYVLPFLRALQSGDKESIYAQWIDGNRTEKSEELFDQLIRLWNGREAVSVKQTGELKRPAEGEIPPGRIYSYDAVCRYDTAKVEISVSDISNKVDWIHITVNPKVTGTLPTWRQFNGAQWLITGAAALEILFTVYMAYKCIKKKPRYWGVWLAFILLVYGGMELSTVGDLKVSFLVYTLAFPKLLIVQGVGMKVYVTLPIGAVIYWVEKGRERHKKEEVNNGF